MPESTELTLDLLRDAVANHAALRRVRRLQPAGGQGDKLFPPTYPVERGPARHIFETRRIGGDNVRCVLMDSVQSQANRLEEALLGEIRAGAVKFPYAVVSFEGQVADGIRLDDIGEITSLDAPHRIFDAIIRDSQLDGTPFTQTTTYQALVQARPTNAGTLYRISPTSLLFGVWNSTGEGGGFGAKFTRCIVSEIIGVQADDGEKAAVRIDPLGIRADAKVVGSVGNWRPATGAAGEKSRKPSEINHSNVISVIANGGVTVDYVLHTLVITCAGLRRLRFPGERDQVAIQTVIAALGLVAGTAQDSAGYALRSRCDLVADGPSPFEVVRGDGTTQQVSINKAVAEGVYNQAVAAANASGATWDTEPLKLEPQPRLVSLVALSRQKALASQAETPTGEN